MSDYTPTTAEVKDATSEDGATALLPEEFERWLKEERARIWDEAHDAPCDTWVVDDMCAEYHPNPYRRK